MSKAVSEIYAATNARLPWGSGSALVALCAVIAAIMGLNMENNLVLYGSGAVVWLAAIRQVRASREFRKIHE